MVGCLNGKLKFGRVLTPVDIIVTLPMYTAFSVRTNKDICVNQLLFFGSDNRILQNLKKKQTRENLLEIEGVGFLKITYLLYTV